MIFSCCADGWLNGKGIHGKVGIDPISPCIRYNSSIKAFFSNERYLFSCHTLHPSILNDGLS